MLLPLSFVLSLAFLSVKLTIICPTSKMADDLFAKIAAKKQSHAVKLKPSSLVIGKEYHCVKVDQIQSNYCDKNGHYPICLLAYFEDAKVQSYVYMPTIYNDLSPSKVKSLNDVCKSDKKPKIVYYGMKDCCHEIDLLKHDQEVDQEKLKLFQENRKRKIEEDGPSTSKHSKTF